MKRVVYYARVSTEEEQQAAALVTQCFENEEFINNNVNGRLYLQEKGRLKMQVD